LDEFIDRYDAGMLQLSGNLGLVKKARTRGGILGAVGTRPIPPVSCSRSHV
jgi:hypothetical protein